MVPLEPKTDYTKFMNASLISEIKKLATTYARNSRAVLSRSFEENIEAAMILGAQLAIERDIDKQEIKEDAPHDDGYR